MGLGRNRTCYGNDFKWICLQQSELRSVAADIIARIHPVITYASPRIIQERPSSVLYIFRVYHQRAEHVNLVALRGFSFQTKAMTIRGCKNFPTMDIHGYRQAHLQ